MGRLSQRGVLLSSSGGLSPAPASPWGAVLAALTPVGGGVLSGGGQRMPLRAQPRLRAALLFVAGWPAFPWAAPGWSLPAAWWLLCAHGFQPLSIRLNGPIQGHSCAAETLAAWTQSAERGSAGPAQENVPGQPASRSPDGVEEPGPRSNPEGCQWPLGFVHPGVGGNTLLRGQGRACSGLLEPLFGSDLQPLSLCKTV